MNKTTLKLISLIIFIVIGIILTICTGCNKQIFDTHYTYTKIICNYDGDKFELDIRKWKDYEGEQLQVIARDGNTYLLSANNCYMVGD